VVCGAAVPGQQSPRGGKMGRKINILNKNLIICTQQILNYYEK